MKNSHHVIWHMWQTSTVVTAANYNATLIVTLWMINIKLISPTDCISEWQKINHVQRHFAAMSSRILITSWAYNVMRPLYGHWQYGHTKTRGCFGMAAMNIFLLMNQMMIKSLDEYFFSNCFELSTFSMVVHLTLECCNFCSKIFHKIAQQHIQGLVGSLATTNLLLSLRVNEFWKSVNLTRVIPP